MSGDLSQIADIIEVGGHRRGTLWGANDDRSIWDAFPCCVMGALLVAWARRQPDGPQTLGGLRALCWSIETDDLYQRLAGQVLRLAVADGETTVTLWGDKTPTADLLAALRGTA